MFLGLAAVVAFSSAGLQAESPAAPPEPTGLKSIFNGKDLSGWDGDKQLWSVRDGVIHGETTPENAAKGNTFLVWQGGEPGDFELRLAFRCNATNNSGIMYRSEVLENSSNPWVMKGYQHEIRNEEQFPNVSGFIYDEKGSRGRICLVGQKGHWEGDKLVVEETLIDEEGFKELFKLDDWNEVVIIAKGANIKHYMNGRLILDFTDDKEHLRTSGKIGVQLHAGKPMWTEFKDVRIKSL